MAWLKLHTGLWAAEMLNRHGPISVRPAMRQAVILWYRRRKDEVPACVAQRRAEAECRARSLLAEKRRLAHGLLCVKPANAGEPLLSKARPRPPSAASPALFL